MYISAITNDGKEIMIPIDVKKTKQEVLNNNSSSILENVVDEISVTLRLSIDEIEKFLVGQVLELLDLPQDTEYTYEFHDSSFEFKFDHKSIQSVSINLYNTLCDDDQSNALLRHAGCNLFSQLIDAGFEIPDNSCINGDLKEDKYIDYTFHALQGMDVYYISLSANDLKLEMDKFTKWLDGQLNLQKVDKVLIK